MSEYQYLYFQAIDRPLDDEQLAFMRRQSTRADVSRWQFTNEYHYGSFRGDAVQMMRRGYDFHLHFASFGVRRLLFRLPAGLPWDDATLDRYALADDVSWLADPGGEGGVLVICPEADAGSYDVLYDIPELASDLASIRSLLLDGDLRPLYLLWLACSFDEDVEPPVPAGLGALPQSLDALISWYEIGDNLVAAAAQASPPLPDRAANDQLLNRWIKSQRAAELRQLVQRLLSDDHATARAETLARVREQAASPAWPTAEPQRTRGQLFETSANLRQTRLAAEQQAAEEKKQRRLAAIAADPDKSIAAAKRLVDQRSTSSYQAAANVLAELREALGPVEGPERTAKVAQKLVRDNPTLARLKSALRKKDLL